jgi:hypothetical protein
LGAQLSADQHTRIGRLTQSGRATGLEEAVYRGTCGVGNLALLPAHLKHSRIRASGRLLRKVWPQCWGIISPGLRTALDVLRKSPKQDLKGSTCSQVRWLPPTAKHKDIYRNIDSCSPLEGESHNGCHPVRNDQPCAENAAHSKENSLFIKVDPELTCYN